MNKVTLKQTLFFVISTMSFVGSPMLHASDAQERLRQLLKDRPELAKQFISQETKQKQAAPVQEQPVQPKPAVAVQPVAQPQPKPVPKPVEKPWITEQEKNDINMILTTLDTYTARVYNCIGAFFNKVNGQPYAMHVASFKSQLEYLRQNLLHKFPHTQTPERQRLFTTFYNLTQALEQAQAILCHTVDQNYTKSSLTGVTSLATQFAKAKALLNKQHGIVNQNIKIIQNELRTPHSQDMLNRINKLQPVIGKVFNYANEKKFSDLFSTIKHRLQR